MSLRSSGLLLPLAFLVVGFAPPAQAVLFTDFAEYGTTVNGYQDDFTGGSLNSAWTVIGGDTGSFTLAGNGTLHITTTGGGPTDDPNKLLYNPATPYNLTTQEVLMLIKVNSDSTDDGFRVGAATASGLSDGAGINLLFRDADPGGATRHFNLLNDNRAWGPTVAGSYAVGTYYWLRILESPNSAGNDDVFGKVWQAGTGEPASFQSSWDYDGGNAGNIRTGLAGLTAGSLGANTDASVDYILIKTSDLPSIGVVPEPASAVSLALGVGALVSFRRRRP